jgi:hypothetical protein
VRSLEEITYDAGRHALADQESLVAGIRQRAGTLLAAHALVASFLGAGALRDAGMTALTWLALITLVAGLVIASVLLAPWRIRFSVDADEVYELPTQDDLIWHADKASKRLVAAALLYQSIRDNNMPVVRWMTRLSLALAALVVIHALLWIAAVIGVE